MSGRVAGKVVVITGAGQGIGAAAARLLAARGATVVATDLLPRPAGDIGQADYHQLDVTDAGGWADLAGLLRDRYGRVDALVACAGVTWRARLPDLAPADLERVSSVNVTGTLLGIQGLLPLLGAGASVVIIGSAAALTGHYPVAYTASKWALRGLAAAACAELGPRGIRVNTVHPGYIDTPMTASAPAEFRAASVGQTPLGRAGTVDDVAPVVLFLVSDESSFISGAEIPVDGGMTAHRGAKPISDAMRDATP